MTHKRNSFKQFMLAEGSFMNERNKESESLVLVNRTDHTPSDTDYFRADEHCEGHDATCFSPFPEGLFTKYRSS